MLPTTNNDKFDTLIQIGFLLVLGLFIALVIVSLVGEVGRERREYNAANNMPCYTNTYPIHYYQTTPPTLLNVK